MRDEQFSISAKIWIDSPAGFKRVEGGVNQSLSRSQSTVIICLFQALMT